MQPEARIVKQIRTYLDDLPKSFFFKIHGSAQMMAGLPDLIGCYHGWFIGIEVKQPGQKPTERQVFVHSMIKRAGGTVIVATSVDCVREMIENIDV